LGTILVTFDDGRAVQLAVTVRVVVVVAVSVTVVK
jgi:hypothetical protein